MRRSVLMIFAGWCAGLLACTPERSPDNLPETYCQTFHEGLCIRGIRCRELGGDLAACVAGLSAIPRLAEGCAAVEAAEASGALRIDHAALRAWYHAQSTVACDDEPSDLPGVLIGQVEAGGACATKAACVADTYCEGLYSGGPPGVCMRRGAPGEPCSGFNCQEGLVCGRSSLTCIAEEPAPVGGDCSEQQCAWGTYCDCTDNRGFSCEGDWRCRPHRAEGEACGGEIGECGWGLLCDHPRAVCVAPALEGEACVDMPLGPSASTNAGCVYLLVCVVDEAGAAEGVCTAPRALGEACFQGSDCRTGSCDCPAESYRCVGPGVCVERAGAGESCAGQVRCLRELSCGDGVCIDDGDG